MGVFKFIKGAIKQSWHRHSCDHLYNITALSAGYVTFRCKCCGKEISVRRQDMPEQLLCWGYGWYHHDPDAATIELLKKQNIAPNNEIRIPAKEVFVVSYFEKLEQPKNRNGRPGDIELGDILTKGFYFSKDKAEASLKGDMARCFNKDYPYACIECYEEGLSNRKYPIRFLHFDSEKCAYTEIEVPAAVRRRIKTIATGVQ